MDNCFGPLGGALAFLGAVGFCLVFCGLIFGIGELITEGGKKFPSILYVAIVGILLLIIVIILGLINQAFVPSGCSR